LPGHSSDDTECSKGGNHATQQLADAMDDIHIDHIVCSPFYRCLQTVAPMARRKQIQIKVEPGICEVLTMFPPGFQDTAKLASEFPIDLDYQPVMTRNELSFEAGDSVAARRAGGTASTLRKQLKGPILFCGHGASCLGIGQAFGGSGYVGYTSVSHFTYDGSRWTTVKAGDVSHLSKDLQDQSFSSAW
jgi:broad specificity phosphatase PhoE